jgi:hypothetical protein
MTQESCETLPLNAGDFASAAGLACKLHQSITGWHAGPVKNAADLDILVINWGHSL